MTPKPLSATIAELGNSINLLHRAGFLLPSTMMTYATIDILAALARPIDTVESTGADFRAWVDRYLLPGSHLACTADDLWGARCGLLHSYLPESRHSRAGKARKLLYVAGVLEESARVRTKFIVGEYVFVVSQDLFGALGVALQKFIDELETDPELGARVASRASQLLVSCTPDSQ